MKKTFILTALFLTASIGASAGTVVIRTRPVVVAPKVHVVHTVKPVRRGTIDINTNRKKAKVYVNGKLVGNAGQYDGWPGKLHLAPGKYTITLKSKGSVYRERVRVVSGHEVNLNVTF